MNSQLQLSIIVQQILTIDLKFILTIISRSYDDESVSVD
jgi:hypothetical protein